MVQTSLGKLKIECKEIEGQMNWEKIVYLKSWLVLNSRPFNLIVLLIYLQNQEILSEGDLVASLNQSDKVRELQDKIASLRAQVSNLSAKQKTIY